MSSENTSYTQLRTLMREAGTLGSVNALLAWDQETFMPSGGADARAEQRSMIATMVHERRTSARVGELIVACEHDASLPETERANVREMRRDYDLLTKLPASLVGEIASTATKAQEAWKDARQNSDFATFRPWLEKMMELARQKAACYGTPAGGEPYDALLEEYEPGARAAELEKVFTPLASELSALIAKIGASGKTERLAIKPPSIDASKQHAFGQFLLTSMGFDMNSGRLDTTAHPFCEGLGPGDTRLTTRYREDEFGGAMYGTLHEMGHGLYEQGLPKMERYGEPLGEAISLGIHESQSRMWENLVGRSRAFWMWAQPNASKMMSAWFGTQSVDALYSMSNVVKPSYIRVEADEATYNLHILLRFTLERALLKGDLSVAELPGAWNSMFETLFGLRVPDDRRGCLQDVHWSCALIGYFPTYSLGNLYAAQFFETARAAMPDLDVRFARGDFAPLLGWLRTNIHQHGRRYRAGELCERVTGKKLDSGALLRYLKGKAAEVYGV
ncbi:MAG: carboxypeptidase M32 [Phycisphaeraceae bacterium]|nr:carboxypeptidase M32 [Phycisphaeraceae bacterium]MBX3366980.1 carboxypeptidase M32 [Phycisphaeraceae bacterium]